MTGLVVKTISSLDDFIALKPQWDALVDSLEEPLIFFTHDWIRIWIDSFIPKAKLHIIVVFEGERLIGAFPLYRSTFATLRIFHQPCLRYLCNSSSAISTLIARSADGERVFDAVQAQLKREQRSFTNIYLEHVPADSDLVKILEREPHASWGKTNYEDWEDCYELDIDGSFDEYFNSLGKSFRKTMRTKMNSLERAGGLRCEISNAYTPQIYERFLDLENTGWKRERGQPLKASRAYTDFYRQVAETFAPRGQFLMLTVYAGNKTVVMVYSVVFKGTCHFFKIAVNYDDPELSKFSPGQIALLEMIRYCFNNKIRRFDFYGACYPYEAHWTKKTYRKHEVMLYKRDDPLMKLRFAIKNVVDAIKKG